MYYLSKICQASALGIIAYGFVMHFPNLMGHNIFLLGIVLFVLGWTVERFFLRK